MEKNLMKFSFNLGYRLGQTDLKNDLKKKINKIFDAAYTKGCVGAYNEKDFTKIYMKEIKKILKLLE